MHLIIRRKVKKAKAVYIENITCDGRRSNICHINKCSRPNILLNQMTHQLDQEAKIQHVLYAAGSADCSVGAGFESAKSGNGKTVKKLSQIFSQDR